MSRLKEYHYFLLNPEWKPVDTPNKISKYITCTLYQLLKRKDNMLKITYGFVELHPLPLGEKPVHKHNIFKLWTGFAAKHIGIYNEDIVAPILYHIKHILCNDDEIIYNYVIKWIAHIFQYPAQLPGTALVFLSLDGAGKSILSDMIVRMIGERHATSIQDLKRLTNRFNSIMEISIFMQCNTIVSIKNKCVSTLKTIITENKRQVEHKNMYRIEIQNCIRVLINSKAPIKISSSDRRLVVIDVNNEYAYENIKDDPDMLERGLKYGKDLNDHVQKQETMNNFATYLMTIPLDNWNPRNIPETEAKEYIQELSQEPFEAWWEEYWSNDPHLSPATSRDLLNRFKEYCDNRKTRGYPAYVGNPRIFGKRIAAHKKDAISKQARSNVVLWYSKKYTII